MAFSLSYQGICERDIHHLYSIWTTKQPVLRKSHQYKAPEFLNELDADKRIREINRPIMEYDTVHGIELPRAPAFRNIQSREVSAIVKRLRMPPSERFNFRHKDHVRYNDWQTAHAQKIERLRDTIIKFGGSSKPMTKRETKHEKHKKAKKHKIQTELTDEATLPVL